MLWTGETLEFHVLGPLEILHRGRNIVPTAPKPRQVIALLILRRNTVVQTCDLIDELWEDNPPASAMTTLQTYVYKLRKTLAHQDAEHLLTTRPGGYQFTVSDSALDLCHFEQLASSGQAAVEAGDMVSAREDLGAALDLWQGPALAGVTQGSLLSSYVTRLDEIRSRILELRIEVDLRLGRHRGLISELKSLVIRYPLHEHLYCALMVALHRSGRRHDALEVYRSLRRNMVDDLGLEPGPAVRELHQALLSDAPDQLMFGPLTGPIPAAAPESAAPAESAFVPVADPAQLPADIADFTGRVDASRSLVAELAWAPRQGRTAIPVAVVTGMPGVGKTTLAVHAGHRAAAEFPDGQLYAELGASTGCPADHGEVLHGFLRALDVAEDRIPAQTTERAKLFRTTTAGRRMLFVFDDVDTAADVRALMPGDPQCAVLVTSRRRLHGLATTLHLDLDVLSPDEAVELVGRIAGEGRLAADRMAARRLADLVARLPLALRCIAGRLATVPGMSIAGMVRHLADARWTLDELRLGDLDVRARYDASYASLSRADQGTFRLLSMLPSTEFTAEAVAELLGWETFAAERAMAGFVDAHLVRVARCDDDQIRYTLPGLTRIYARERLSSALSPALPERLALSSRRRAGLQRSPKRDSYREADV
ncbi:BTAD domain-containing putative transcriptional regulator [Micromonospora ureilytica]|uniref:BTAD domain-containing putative transcriptional regulator n=1 Tax=Micromonospora ureilytica TaxID=709868 RepID=UPI00403A3CB5